MNFFDQLQQETAADRKYLMTAPLVGESAAGNVTLEYYVAYLCQAYHHVKHTVPLLMATGARLPESHEWLRAAVAEYIEEECGHQEWILNDIEACGFDREAAHRSQPTLATELMVAYAYDTVQRNNPVGFFGMVHVLEGTSIAAADSAAAGIQRSLGLPDAAITYLRSHGALDQSHVKFFASLMNRIDAVDEQQCILHCARVFYRLFGDVLRSVSPEQGALLPRQKAGTEANHAA
jgi:pyrroloquinoline quinone (PQQ) biosynthesis protein C